MPTFDQRPHVISVIPKTYATDIPTSLNEVRLYFNTDLDQDHIDGYIRLQNKTGETVPITVTYANRIITATLSDPLEPNATYQIVVIGDSNLKDDQEVGIRNVFGNSMAGIYDSAFTTVANETLPAPTIISPTNQSLLKTAPSFEWEAITNAEQYEIRLSRSNSMFPLIWPTDSNHQTTSTGPIDPDIAFDDGIYYWRVRALDADGNKGKWTSVLSFNINTVTKGPVSEDDTLAPGVGLTYDPFVDEDVTFIESFPQNQQANIATGLKSFHLRVQGHIDAANIDVSMIGTSLIGEDEDHGEVHGYFTVTHEDNNTTLITYHVPLLDEGLDILQSSTTVKAGDSFGFYADITDDEGEPAIIDISHLASQVRDEDGTLLSDLTIETTDTEGRYLLSTNDTDHWPVGTVYMDIQHTEDDGTVISSQTVAITVEEGITE